MSDRTRQLAAKTAECEALQADLARERQRAEAAERERDDARDWVRKMVRETQELRCAFCGETYPPNTPASNDDRLSQHIRICAKHPMRRLEAQLAKVRRAICFAAIPLEALRMVEMDGNALSPEMKKSIVEATDAMRAALAAEKEY